MCRRGSDLRKNGLTERGTRSANAVKTAEVLIVEEVHSGGRLCVAGGADHRLRGLMHQVGDALEVNRKVTTLQSAERKGRRGGEVPVANEAGRDREQVDIRERRRVVGETVRILLRVRQLDRHWLRWLRAS